MKGGGKVARMTRTRVLEVPKENNYICGKCGATGDCGESKESMKPDEVMYWDENAGDHGKIICGKCGKWLETKKELYDFSNILEIQQYGFWLRFASEHFIPCYNCQEKLHEMITINPLAFSKSDCITLEEYPKKGEWLFSLQFFQIGNSRRESRIFIPCVSCQENILRNIDKKELHIGVDEKPLVELWRKWEIIEE